MVGSAEKGSMTAVSQSGFRTMSDSLMTFQPAIEEPSNMMPSANMSSSTVSTYCVVCCHLPRGSVNLKSICFTSLSLIAFRTSWGVLHCSDITIAPLGSQYANSLRALDRVASGFSRPDPNRFLDGGDEDLAVADTAGVGRLLYRLDRPLDHSVFHHDFHF